MIWLSSRPETSPSKRSLCHLALHYLHLDSVNRPAVCHQRRPASDFDKRKVSLLDIDFIGTRIAWHIVGKKLQTAIRYRFQSKERAGLDASPRSTSNPRTARSTLDVEDRTCVSLCRSQTAVFRTFCR
jgi:hypothetical protein